MPAIFSHPAVGRVRVGRAALQVLCWWVPCPPRGIPVGCSPGAAPVPGSVPAAGTTQRLLGSQLSPALHLPVTLAPRPRDGWLCHRSRHIPACPSLLPLRAQVPAALGMVMDSTGLLPGGEMPEKWSNAPVVAAGCCLPGSRRCPGTTLPDEPSTGPGSGLATGMEASKRPLRSSTPTNNQALSPSPLNYVPRYHIHTFLEHYQGARPSNGLFPAERGGLRGVRGSLGRICPLLCLAAVRFLFPN